MKNRRHNSLGTTPATDNHGSMRFTLILPCGMLNILWSSYRTSHKTQDASSDIPKSIAQALSTISSHLQQVSKGYFLEMNYPGAPTKSCSRRERICSGLVMVNEENINHLKCYFGAHKMEMKHNMKCSFISEGLILFTSSHSILFLPISKVWGKEH